MPTIHIQRDHPFSMAEAHARLNALADKLKERLDVASHWEGDELLLEREGAKGRVRVLAQQVSIEITLSVFLSPFKGALEDAIQDYLDDHLKVAEA